MNRKGVLLISNGNSFAKFIILINYRKKKKIKIVK